MKNVLYKNFKEQLSYYSTAKYHIENERGDNIGMTTGIYT